ncbi:MAG: C-type lectin domain-containing protein [Marinifilaceae bacterium]
MKRKKRFCFSKKISVLLLVCAVTHFDGYAQVTFWNEDFSSYADNTGVDGSGDIEDYPGGVSKWTLDVSNGNLSGSSDYFKVTGGRLRGRDVDGEIYWISEVINIDGYSDVGVSVDLWEDGRLEPQDFIRCEYQIDGAGWTQFYYKSDDFSSTTAQVTSLIGVSLELRITIKNSSGNEYYNIDDILVTGILNSQPPVVSATGDQGYCNYQDSIPVVTSISISDPDDDQIDAVFVQISAGYVNGEDGLVLTGTHPNITATWNATLGKLSLSGPALFTEFEAAIAAVVFFNISASPTLGARSISITLGEPNYLPSTEHFYEFVPALGIRWDEARDAAALREYYGLKGYLATITSQEEADLAGSQITGAGWLGGSDQDTEGTWKWVTGPDAGTVFWNGGVGGSTPNYAFWNTGEPNQAGDEDYVHITAPSVGIPGSWNDLSITGAGSGNYQPKGYVVEYGGSTGDPVLSISASTRITVSIAPQPIGIFFD